MYFCYSRNSGELIHFPAGTFDAQMKKFKGRFELSMIDKLFRTMKAYKRFKNDKWNGPGESDHFESDMKLLQDIGFL